MGAISFNNKLYPTGGTPSASMSVYDNSDSGLQATNVQDAVDEVVADVKGWTDITLQCTYNYCRSGTGRILYNETLKLLYVGVILEAGAPNQGVFLTLPSHIRGSVTGLCCQEFWDEGSSLQSIIVGNLQAGTFRTSHSINTALSIGHGIAFLIPVV